MRNLGIRIVCVCIMMVMVLFAGQVKAGKSLTPLTIQLDWLTNVEFAGILLAKDRGWYEEAGIDLTIKGWEMGISPIEEVVSGKAQIALSGGADLIVARRSGAKVKAIAAQFQKSPYCLISKTAQGIKEPKDLAGKKIGISAADTALVTQIILASQGLKYKDIIPVDIGWNLERFMNDEVDGVVAYMTNEPLVLKEKGYDINYLSAFKHGYDFYSEVFVVTEKMIQEQPDAIQKFWKATVRGWQETLQNPQATAEFVVEKYYPQGTVPHQTKSLELFQYLMTFGIGDKLIGMMEYQLWEKSVDILYEFQKIDKKVSAGDLFTLKFLKKTP